MVQNGLRIEQENSKVAFLTCAKSTVTLSALQKSGNTDPVQKFFQNNPKLRRVQNSTACKKLHHSKLRKNTSNSPVVSIFFVKSHDQLNLTSKIRHVIAFSPKNRRFIKIPGIKRDKRFLAKS